MVMTRLRRETTGRYCGRYRHAADPVHDDDNADAAGISETSSQLTVVADSAVDVEAVAS
jgi:hypothetical protein